ncbi:MAG: hypothetical protein R3C58_12525, partial [Parvularculaceae bacterium]
MTRAASLWPPSRNRLWIVFGVWAAVTLATAAALYAGAGDGRFGDFAAFHAAGRAATEGNAARIYDPGVFGAYLETFYPGQPNRLSWQYPPTYFFIAAPLS